MESNVSKRTYNEMDALATEIRNRGDMNKPVDRGLLAPMKRITQPDNKMAEHPAYRVAQTFNTIRNKRMELKSG